MIPEASKGLVWTGSAWVPMDYPWQIQILPIANPIVMAGTVSLFASAIIGGGAVFNSSAALNDEFGWDVQLAAGTWTLSYWHRRSPADAIMQPKLDGANLGGTVDMYTAGTTNNIVESLSTVVAASGKKRLSFKATGKNALATAHTMILQCIDLRRTA